MGSIRFNLERLNELEVFLKDDRADSMGFRRVPVVSKDHPYMKKFWTARESDLRGSTRLQTSVNHYIECLAEDKALGPIGATFHDGYKAMLILDAISESSRTERWVRVPE